MGELQTSIQYLQGVGPKRAELLQKELGIGTIGDLLQLYPFRYIDRSGIRKIADIASESAFVQILGKVVSRTLYGKGGAAVDTSSGQPHFNAVSRMSVIVEDDSGRMEMVFFRGIKWNYQRLSPGSVFVFYGKPQEFNGRFNMVHPEVDTPQQDGAAQGSLTGVYPSTEKLKNAGITGKVMCRMQAAALSLCLPEVTETLPEYIIRENALCSRAYALSNIHFPKDQYALDKAVRRLKFEELFFLQLSLLKQKYVRSRSEHGLIMPHVGPDFHACYNALPYSLTGAQQRVIKEIREDMRCGRQMNRLLQGDVGSGKTMVAVLSCLIAKGNGFQSCIMAPTEVLAQQHFANISKYLQPTQTHCALLTGSTGARERREIDAGLRDGSIDIIVGTHALLEDNVVFKALGFAVIDEQHRFGVDQRAKLWSKGPAANNGQGDFRFGTEGKSNEGTRVAAGTDSGRCGHPWPHKWEGPTSPDVGGTSEASRSGVSHGSHGCIPPHILVMTATPIPRTLAMTVYGDLDVSVIDEMPPGRKPVQTMCITPAKLPAMYKFLKQEIAKGRQVFIVYPMIFENEKIDITNVEQGYEEIMARFRPQDGYKTALVHGQQNNDEKNFNMQAFAEGRAQMLVSTTVIEVGVDVPNASVMVIMSAQRFGLSQLHQLRGRVGRGAEKSYCILVQDYKTSKEAKARLDLMCATENGFEIAEEDMKMRGPGDLEGTQQSGLPISLNIASLAKDGRMLAEARAYATKVLEADPMLESGTNSLLVSELKKEKYAVRDYSKIS